MTDLPPAPFDYECVIVRKPETPITHDGQGHVYIVDANKRKIASLWGKPAEKIALAKLIVAARAAVKRKTT